MRRVLLDKNGLRVSKSGYDVTTATGSQLAMDTRASKYIMTLLQGSIAFSAFTLILYDPSTYVDTWHWQYVLNFGFATATPPIVLLTSQDPMQTDGTCVAQVYYNEAAGLTSSFAGTAGTGGLFYTEYAVTTSNLTIDLYKDVFSISSYNPPTPAFYNYSVTGTL